MWLFDVAQLQVEMKIVYLYRDLGKEQSVLLTHGDSVSTVAKGFSVGATTAAKLVVGKS